MEANERMPGDNEAAAAIAAMLETYGVDLIVGDWVTFRRDHWPAGRTASGKIHAKNDVGFLVEIDGEIAYCRRDELVEVCNAAARSEAGR